MNIFNKGFYVLKSSTMIINLSESDGSKRPEVDAVERSIAFALSIETLDKIKYWIELKNKPLPVDYSDFLRAELDGKSLVNSQLASIYLSTVYPNLFNQFYIVQGAPIGTLSRSGRRKILRMPDATGREANGLCALVASSVNEVYGFIPAQYGFPRIDQQQRFSIGNLPNPLDQIFVSSTLEQMQAEIAAREGGAWFFSIMPPLESIPKIDSVSESRIDETLDLIRKFNVTGSFVLPIISED